MCKQIFFICILLLSSVHSRPSNDNGYGNGTSLFAPGNGLGSIRNRNMFKTALAGSALGAVGGLAAFEFDKAIIPSPSTPFHHNSKEYYLGQEYYQQKSDEIRCLIPLNSLIDGAPAKTTTVASGFTTVTPRVVTPSSPNQLISHLQFADGTRPKEMVWSCKKGIEICCGTDCCPTSV